MTRTRTSLLGLLILLAAHPASSEVLWQDDFDGSARYETNGPRAWTIGEGRCVLEIGAVAGRLLPPIRPVADAVITTDFTPTKRVGGDWSTAGLALHDSPANHWRLLLVEGPEGRRYFELIESLNGVHQAQGHAGTVATKLESVLTGDLQSWDYDKRYALTLSIDPEHIEGRIADEDGGYWQRTFSFSRGRAVKRGRACLTAGGMCGVFHSMKVDGVPPVTGETIALKRGAAGTVAILRDEPDVIAPKLAEAFGQAGYGVTLVDWRELGPKQLPAQELDLFVLADARAMSVGARDELLSLLHTGGKVMAIGAPALSELRMLTPDGWRGPLDWKEPYARGLARVPMQIAPDAWQKSAMWPDRLTTIEPDPAEGDDCWKLGIDLDLGAWGGLRADIPGAFGEDRGLLAFEAKGDANTPQMSIEFVEQDHSRWIATVELGDDWRTYLLSPRDFPYWKDSDAEGRGGAGDCVRLEAVAAMSIGFSASHTSKVKPGHHTAWLRGLSTAPATGLPDVDFSPPDIEALCPSYKLYPMDEIARLQRTDVPTSARSFPWTGRGYSPVWRERGRGLNRGRAWRWVPILDAFDAQDRKRGSLISLMIGDGTFPNAVWANVGVADPQQALDPRLLPWVIETAKRMTSGCFLLEGGAELFSYLPGEEITLGARAVNLGREGRELLVGIQVLDHRGAGVFERDERVEIAPDRERQVTWRWRPERFDAEGYTVIATLADPAGAAGDTITQRIEALRSEPAGPEEFVRVEGSNFMLGDEKWFFKGINYRPTWIAGHSHLNFILRECYDPEIVERDLTWMESIGINALSAVFAIRPPDTDDPRAFRDQLDFLDRCDRHGMKCFFIVPYGRPYAGADVEKLIDYITRAGIKDHPAIMCWELAWEPITGPWQGGMEFMLEDWNGWVVQRYGSPENAVTDWGFDPGREDAGIPIPTSDMCNTHGKWDKYVAGFRRAFSDILSAKYRDVVRPLREWDPKHTISFRGGACGIPGGHRFAHVHSVGVAKHMDFLNPEGYDLRTTAWGMPTPADDIRRGGLVTLYYRFISREKPIVWMEFGYTVSGYHHQWLPELVHVDPHELEVQKQEHENFYSMIIESGSRGAAPWWLPGGFRLGENSDFGILEPDGAERPACDVLRKYHPLFDRVTHPTPSRFIDVDFDRHYADAWEIYSQQYLEAMEAGEIPYVKSGGTGTDSATCPLTAVGGGEYTGHNPPQFLNAEFNHIELRIGDGPWQRVLGGETLEIPRGARVLCRASVGNIGEAAWLAPGADDGRGRVFIAGRSDYGLQFRAPIAADTPFLADAEVSAFTLVEQVQGTITVSFEMMAADRAHFGERRTVVLTAPN